MKAPFTSQEIQMLSEAYRTPLLEADQEIPKDGAAHQVAFVRTAHDGKVVVKRFNLQVTRRKAEDQVRIQNFVYEQDIPTPFILQNRYGSGITEHDGSMYIVMTYLRGRHPDKTVQAEVDVCLEGLAKVDTVLALLPDPESYEPLDRYRKSLRKQLEELKPFLPKTPANEIDEYVLKTLPRVDSLVTEVESRVSRIHHPKQLIFGDFTITNVLVHEGKLSGVIDYELARLDFRGADPMHTLDLFCFDKETPALPLEARVNWDRLKASFAAYVKHDPDIIVEVSDMPTMLANNVGLNSLILVWRWGYDPSFPDNLKSYFKRRYEFFTHRVDIALELEDRLVKTLKEAHSS